MSKFFITISNRLGFLLWATYIRSYLWSTFCINSGTLLLADYPVFEEFNAKSVGWTKNNCYFVI